MLARSRRRAREKSFLSQVIRRPNDERTWVAGRPESFCRRTGRIDGVRFPKQILDAVPFDRYHPYVGY